MEVKIYVPKLIDIPSEYLPALAQRAIKRIGNQGGSVSATRGHLVRQAVADGLLRELDELTSGDGKIDLYCDPQSETPMVIDNQAVTLDELVEAMQSQRAAQNKNDQVDPLSNKIVPTRRAA